MLMSFNLLASTCQGVCFDVMLSTQHQIPDSDLLKRRVGQKVDPISNEVLTMSVYKAKDKDKKGEAGYKEEGENGENEKDEEEKEENEEEKESDKDEYADDLVSNCFATSV